MVCGREVVGEAARPGDVRVLGRRVGVHPQRQRVVAPRHVAAAERGRRPRPCARSRRPSARAAAAPSGPAARRRGATSFVDRLVGQVVHELGLHVGADALRARRRRASLCSAAYGIGWTMSISGWATSRIGAITRSPSAWSPVQQTTMPDDRLEVHLRRDERLGRRADERDAGAEVVRRVGHVARA